MKFLASTAVLFFAFTSFAAASPLDRKLRARDAPGVVPGVVPGAVTALPGVVPPVIPPVVPPPAVFPPVVPPIAVAPLVKLPAPTAANDYDIIILGATPAGITAALSASRILSQVKKPVKILILERSSHIGGIVANGLGAVTSNTRGATGGLYLEFVNNVKKYYVDKYGKDSKQVKECEDGYRYEPHVAELVLTNMLKGEEAGRIDIKLKKQFDAKSENLVYDEKEGNLKTITVFPVGGTNTTEKYNGKYFVDASYEGDLIAAAKIPYSVGREGEEVYRKEKGAGKVYKYWGGKEHDGSTHKGDSGIQAYNFRLALTNNATNVAPFTKPATYNRTEYISIIKDIVNNCVTIQEGRKNCDLPMPTTTDWKTKKPSNRKNWLNGITWITSNNVIPNGKTDGNNQHMVHLSTDLPEENWKYPDGDWAWRDKFTARLRDYTMGLLYFAQNDEELPTWFKDEIKGWGLAKDEYTDNNNFPRQMYIREARRMKGKYIFTAHDALKDPYKWDSVTAAHYNLDSHGVMKREPNRAHLDGFVSYPVDKSYTIPIRVMIPSNRTDGKLIKNLLAPVPVSSSHMGLSTLRMESTWMALGQAAGTLFGLFLKDNYAGVGSVYSIDVWRVQNALLDRGAVIYHTKELHQKKDPKGWQQEKIKKLRDAKNKKHTSPMQWINGKQKTLGLSFSDYLNKAKTDAEAKIKKEIADLQAKLANPANLLAQVKTEIETKWKKEIVDLEAKLKTAGTLVGQAKDEAEAKLKKEIADIQAKLTNPGDAFTKAKDELEAKLKKQIADLQAKLGNAGDAMAKAKAEVEAKIKKEIADIEAKLKNTSTLVGQAKDEAEAKLKKELAEAQAKLNNTGDAIAKAKAEAEAKIKKEIADIEAKLKNTSTLVGQAKDEAEAKLKKELAEAQAKLNNPGDALAKAAAEAEAKLKKEIADIEAKLKTAGTLVGQAKDEAEAKLKKELAEAQAKLQNPGDAILKAAVEADVKLKKEIADIEAKLKTAGTLVGQAKDEAEAKLKKELADAQAKLAGSADAIAKAKAALDEKVKKEIADIQAKLSTTGTLVGQAKDEAEAKLKKELADAEARLKSSGDALAKATVEAEAKLKQNLTDAEAKLKKELEDAKKKVDEEKKKLEDEKKKYEDEFKKFFGPN
ncbi:FAD dependent oxidoreductase-domain-containing protein [Peziza echinospora]|nr:FAD dependent oxidoreductase-domain-containing protein [Peziza echinospora]